MSEQAEQIKLLVSIRDSVNKQIELMNMFIAQQHVIKESIDKQLELLKVTDDETATEESIEISEPVHSKRGTRWTKEEIEQLKRERLSGLSMEKIAGIHGRSLTAIRLRCLELDAGENRTYR